MSRAIEFRLRRRAAKVGLALCKSREHYQHANNRGGYMLIDIDTKGVYEGANFDLTLNDIEKLVTARTEKLRTL